MREQFPNTKNFYIFWKTKVGMPNGSIRILRCLMTLNDLWSVPVLWATKWGDDAELGAYSMIKLISGFEISV